MLEILLTKLFLKTIKTCSTITVSACHLAESKQTAGKDGLHALRKHQNDFISVLRRIFILIGIVVWVINACIGRTFPNSPLCLLF